MGLMTPFNNISAVLSRGWMAGLLGMQFNGARDLYTVFGYKRKLMHVDFLLKYLRQDIASRCINAPVDATWTDAPILKADGAKGVAWAKAWDDFAATNMIYPSIRKADIFCGLGMFSVMVLGFDDGRSLSQPVNASTEGKRKLLYMQPYLEGSVSISKFDENQLSPRFGQPEMYEITPGDLLTTQYTSTSARYQLRNKFQVHWTRVLHIADNTLENNVFGHSRLEPIYNTLDDLLKVSGGSAETYWLTANRGLSIDIDKDMELDPQDAKDLSEEIDEYQHQLRRVIRTRGTKITSLGSDTPSPKDPFGVLMSLLSSQTGIPQRVLMGAEAGQLASQQDRANWAARIAERTGNFAEPFILRPFVAKVMAAGCIPTLEGNFTVTWPEPFKMNPLERAQTSAQMARSAVNVVRAMEVSQKGGYNVASVEEAREIIAPGNRMPVWKGLPAGTMIPKIQDVPLPQQPPDSGGSGSNADGGDESDEEEEEDRQENVAERNDIEDER